MFSRGRDGEGEGGKMYDQLYPRIHPPPHILLKNSLSTTGALLKYHRLYPRIHPHLTSLSKTPSLLLKLYCNPHIVSYQLRVYERGDIISCTLGSTPLDPHFSQFPYLLLELYSKPTSREISVERMGERKGGRTYHQQRLWIKPPPTTPSPLTKPLSQEVVMFHLTSHS
ncbi:hypothetical protein J6590_093867 [Homalodisca vitripennis]|nr:hypothetical protein J6590_093867 [Homalodisca vitripennis]